MPRTHRIDFPGARHHVMNRAARRATVFADDAACALFLDILAELPDRFAVRIHGHAIMPNHFHVLVETPRANLSLAMRHLGAELTQRLNRRHGWDGPIFRGRFRNRVAGDGRYWMHLLAYLHLNPVAAGLVVRPEESRWTSHRAYLGLDSCPPWLTTGELLDLFGGREGLAEYIEEHRTGRGTSPDGWDAGELWKPEPSAVVLSDAPESEVGFPPPAARLAIADVVRVTGCPEGRLFTVTRGRRDNRARWVAAWWLSRRSGLTHRQIGLLLGCRASGVSQMLAQLAERREEVELSHWLAALEGQ